MRKAHRTKVIINGRDVSPHVFRLNLPRDPGGTEAVELTIEYRKLEVADDGTLTIHIDTPEE